LTSVNVTPKLRNMDSQQARTPAQLIEARLQERGWSQRVLAVVLGMNEQMLSRIMAGSKPVDAELALKLKTILGIDPQRLLQLQQEYELAKAQIELRFDPGLSTRAALFEKLPVADMVKRGWFSGITDVRDGNLESAMCRFFGESSVEQIEIFPHAAKKTNVFGDVSPAQLAWLYRVRQMAIDLPAAKYSSAALTAALSQLKSLMISAEGARKVPRLMMEAGVRFVIVEALPSSKIDGVCFWLDGRHPVIGMTLRFDRIDNFWFVLRHEIEHVLREHGLNHAMLDAELEGDKAGVGAGLPDEERVANKSAADFCVPRAKLTSFIARKSPMFAERDIRGFAATLEVHPGIVAGQLQHETGRYDLFRNHLAKIRTIVTSNAFVDGWGDVAPIGA